MDLFSHWEAQSDTLTGEHTARDPSTDVKML